MHVTVVSPERAVFDGAADAVVAPAYDGQVGILPGHAPFLALLGTGVLAVSRVASSRSWGGAGGATRSGSWPIGSKSLDRSRGRP